MLAMSAFPNAPYASFCKHISLFPGLELGQWPLSVKGILKNKSQGVMISLGQA